MSLFSQLRWSKEPAKEALLSRLLYALQNSCIGPRPTMQMTSLIRGVVSGQPKFGATRLQIGPSFIYESTPFSKILAMPLSLATPLVYIAGNFCEQADLDKILINIALFPSISLSAQVLLRI